MTEHYLNQITYSGNYTVIHCVTLRAHPSNQTLDKIQERVNPQRVLCKQNRD